MRLFVALFLFLSIHATKTVSKELIDLNGSDQDPSTLSIYMHTGFYLLAEPPLGVKMQLKGTKEFYHVNRVAFGAINNITNIKLERIPYGQGQFTNVTITFDRQGTDAIAKATTTYQKIAVVIANQLFYVPVIRGKITTGVMNVSIENYSETEISALKKEMAAKKIRVSY